MSIYIYIICTIYETDDYFMTVARRRRVTPAQSTNNDINTMLLFRNAQTHFGFCPNGSAENSTRDNHKFL